MSICCLEKNKAQKTSRLSCPAAVLGLDSNTLKQENHPPSNVRRLLISSLKNIVCLICVFHGEALITKKETGINIQMSPLVTNISSRQTGLSEDILMQSESGARVSAAHSSASTPQKRNHQGFQLWVTQPRTVLGEIPCTP